MDYKEVGEAVGHRPGWSGDSLWPVIGDKNILLIPRRKPLIMA